MNSADEATTAFHRKQLALSWYSVSMKMA